MSFDHVNVNVSGPIQPTSTYKTKILKGNHSFASQVTEPNTKYVVKHDFDLGGESVTIPEGCLLEFDGGAVSNGTLVLSNTIILGFGGLNCQLEGTLGNVKASVSWCKESNSFNVQQLLNLNPKVLEFDKDTTYRISVEIKSNIIIDGNGCKFIPLHVDQDQYDFNFIYYVFKADGVDNIIIHNCAFEDTTHPNIDFHDQVPDIESYPVIWVENAKELQVIDCSFKDLEGYSNNGTLEPWNYGKNRGLLVSVTDSYNTKIENCEVNGINYGEQFVVVPSNNFERKDVSVSFCNNYIHDVIPVDGSFTDFVAGDIVCNNNIVDTFVYKGSIFNCFGLNVEACGNVVKNSFATSVFDCCEYGTFNAMYVNVCNNYVECTNSIFLVAIAEKISIQNNTHKGFSLLLALNYGVDYTSYDYFYKRSNPIHACRIVDIRNNQCDLTNYDGSKPVTSPEDWQHGITLKLLAYYGEQLIIENNYIKSIEEFQEDDVNGFYERNRNTPIYIQNIKNATIKGNTFVGANKGSDYSETECFISVGNIGLVTGEPETTFSIDNVVIDRNSFDTQKEGAYILQSVLSPSSYTNIKNLDIERNISEDAGILFCVNVGVTRGTVVDNGDSQLDRWPFENLETDLTVATNRIGAIVSNKTIDFKGFLVRPVDTCSFPKYKESLLSDNYVIENGGQVMLDDNSVWKCLGVTEYSYESQKETISSKIMKWLGVFWIKLYSPKALNFASIPSFTIAELPTLTDDFFSASYTYGASAFVTDVDNGKPAWWNGSAWVDATGTTV